MAESAAPDQETQTIDQTPAEATGGPPQMPAWESAATLSDQPWLLSLWRPLLISLLSSCLVVAFLAFVRRLVPELPQAYTGLLLAIGLVVAIIGCISTTWLAQPTQRSKRSAGYRTAELALILLITRVGIWAATGDWPGFELILRPLDTLLDGYFVAGAFAVLLAWMMATAMSDDLLGMALRPDDLYMARTYTDRWQDTARPVYTDRPAILRRFTARWVIGGIFLVILAAGSRIAPPQPGFFLPVMHQNIDRNVILSVVIYFMTGLVLISQGQLALLRSRWTLQKTPSAPNVLRNWPFYALTLIVVIGVGAALLPLGGTFHLARILGAIITGIRRIMFNIFQFFLTPSCFWPTSRRGRTGRSPPHPGAAAADHVQMWRSRRQRSVGRGHGLLDCSRAAVGLRCLHLLQRQGLQLLLAAPPVGNAARALVKRRRRLPAMADQPGAPRRRRRRRHRRQTPAQPPLLAGNPAP